jgi:FlaG/FlaF family flagellin (archaellin)
MSTTIFHSEYKTNGSMQILGRTDINDAGTVTKVTTDMHNNSITLYVVALLSWLKRYADMRSAPIPQTISKSLLN